MECSRIEQWLSEYLESSLPAEEMENIAAHLETCSNCAALFSEMRSVLSMCRSYPVLEFDPDFMDKILLRTSGHPRTLSFGERLNQHFLRPLLTPRFAVGASLATLFLVLMTNLIVPRFSGTAAALSPSELLRYMDQGVQHLYGQVLKANDLKDSWSAEISRFGTNTWNSMRSIMEIMDAPVEGQKKPRDGDSQGDPQKEKPPKEKSSGLMSWPA
jgi:hypothetical protein